MMIKIIIFSLLLCIFNTDAAEGFAGEGPELLTSQSAASNYRMLHLNLAQSGFIAARSLMLYICRALSEPHWFRNENHLLQIDINIILYALSQESAQDPFKLADIFHAADDLVFNGGERVCGALSQCVPELHPTYDCIKNCFPNESERSSLVDRIQSRYAKKHLERFSLSLKYAVWKVEPVDSVTHAKRHAWLTGASVKRHYKGLESNLAKKFVTVKNSVMLQVCFVLSQKDFWEKTDIMLEADIETILYLLFHESKKNADTLAQTFRAKDMQISTGSSIMYAFKQCVPDFGFHKIETVLGCLPSMYERSEIVHSTKKRYTRLSDISRFSGSLREILSKWKKRIPDQYAQPLQDQMRGAVVQQCPPQPLQHPSSAEGPCEATKVTDWFTGAAAQRHYRKLTSALEQYRMTPENSMMLYICSVLSRPDFFQNANCVLQTDIEIIMYTLSQKSTQNSFALKCTFLENDAMSRQGSLSYAFALCLPELNLDVCRTILKCFPQVHDQFVVDLIMERYQKQGVARCSESLHYAVWKMASVGKVDHAARLAWWSAKSAQKNFRILQVNLEREHVEVADSAMLQVCCALSQPDFFQKTDIRLESDIETLLYLLCKESESNAEKLAQTFRQEDDKIAKGATTILNALGVCAPPLQPHDIQKVLAFLPNVYNRNNIMKSVKYRYDRVGEQKFSGSLRAVLSNWKRYPNPECTPQSQTADLSTESEFAHLVDHISNILEEDEKEAVSQTADLYTEPEFAHLAGHITNMLQEAERADERKMCKYSAA